MSVWSLNVKYIRKLVRFISCQIYGVNFDVLLLLCHPVPYQQYHVSSTVDSGTVRQEITSEYFQAVPSPCS